MNKPVTSPPSPTRRSDAATLSPLDAFLLVQVEAILEAKRAYRRGEPDAIHRIRVAVRRAISVLTEFGSVVGSPTDVSELSSELLWLSKQLGGARDREVQQKRLCELFAELDPELIVGPVRRRLQLHFDGLEMAESNRVELTLDSMQFKATLDSLREFASSGREWNETDHNAVIVVVAHAERRVAKRLRDVQSEASGSVRDAAVHRMRKAVRRLRYIVEAFEPMSGQDVGRAISTLTTLQLSLGEHQDSVIGREQLRALRRDAELCREDTFTLGILYQREIDNGDRAIGNLVREWHRAERACRAFREHSRNLSPEAVER